MTCRLSHPLASCLAIGAITVLAADSYSQEAVSPVTPSLNPISQYPAKIKTVIQVKTTGDKLVNENWNLAATVDMPSSGKPTAVVVIIPGAGDEDKNGLLDGKPSQPTAKTAQELAASGLAVVRYDKFGVGGSLRHPGDLGRSDLRRFAQDATSVLMWVREQKPFEGLSVYACGRSEGGLIALSLAWQAPKLVNGIICIDIPSSTPWVWLWRQMELAFRKQGFTDAKIEGYREEFVQGVVAIINNNQVPALHPEVGEALFHQNQNYQQQLFKMDPLAYAKDLKVPSIFAVSRQNIYALSDAQKLADTAISGGSKSTAKALVSAVTQSSQYSSELALLISGWIKGLK
ncbi:MAG: alpha/beta hydrolase [Armatimonadota bacterium]